MFTTAIHGETLVRTILHNSIPMELISVPTTMWCGSIAYASNLTDEPDIPALLAKYQANCQYPKLHRANPEWDNCISIDYWQEGAVPRGMVFSQQVTSDKQDPAHDIYRMPQSLYIRLACTKEVSQAAFGKDECGVWELFGVIKDALDELGYKIGTNGAQEIEMYNHGAGLAYAYVQVEDRIKMKQISIHPFPSGAESNGFIAALSSAMLPCLSITEETPYWCAPNGSFCTDCGGCSRSGLTKHQEMLYHILLAASGLAFTFDYPEDDDVGFHTMPDTPIGWRWEEPFVENIMDFAGLSYMRCTNTSVPEMRDILRKSIDAGYTALCADTRNISGNGAWSRCWNVVCGYMDDSLLVMRHGGEIVTETDGTYSDWIVITGKAERKQTYRDVLARIYAVLTDPSHDALEQEIYADLSDVTEENAVGLAYKMMGINGVPIETRWHAAEAFCSSENLLSSLTDDAAVKSRLSDLFFSRYIADNNNETHGIGWKIWGLLHVGPETGCMPTEESFVLIQQPEVQAEMKRLWKVIFDNDRAVAAGIYEVLKGME